MAKLSALDREVVVAFVQGQGLVGHLCSTDGFRLYWRDGAVAARSVRMDKDETGKSVRVVQIHPRQVYTQGMVEVTALALELNGGATREEVLK